MINIWHLKPGTMGTAGLWWQVQFHWNVGPSVRNMWSFTSRQVVSHGSALKTGFTVTWVTDNIPGEWRYLIWHYVIRLLYLCFLQHRSDSHKQPWECFGLAQSECSFSAHGIWCGGRQFHSWWLPRQHLLVWSEQEQVSSLHFWILICYYHWECSSRK